MPHPRASSDDDAADISSESVAQAAADWFVRRDRGLSAPDAEAFGRWLDADPNHAEIYGEIDRTWTLLRQAESPAATVPARRAGRWRPFLFAGATLAAAAGLAFLVVTSPALHPRAFAATNATLIGEVRRIDLPDGSVLHLSTDSAVRVEFGASARRVALLRGEVSCEVAKNATWPFIVHAARVDVRAVGTAFDVQLRADSVELLVTEGRVSVSDSLQGKSLLVASAAAS